MVDTQGRWHLRPFIYRLVLVPGRFNTYAEDRSIPFPIRLFTRSSGLHLLRGR